MMLIDAPPSLNQPLRQRQDADGDAMSLGASLLGAASLGVVLVTGASDSVPVVDVLLPDGEHATNAAPIAKINRTRLIMKTSWDTNDAMSCAADWGRR
jgi:hypothetical protein